MSILAEASSFASRIGNLLLDEPDRHWVTIKLSVARLDGGDDDEDRVQHPKDRQKGEPNQDQTKDHRDPVVDGHRDLEVEDVAGGRRSGVRNQTQAPIIAASYHDRKRLMMSSWST